MAKNENFVSHKKSKQIVDGKPKLPLATDLVEGEIAINFGKDVETLSIKNESGDVVTFSSDNYYTEQKLGSGFTGENSGRTVTDVIVENEEIVSSALNDLNDKIDNLDLGDEIEVNSGDTPSGQTIELWIDESITPIEADVYTKNETSGATQISTALEGKLDASAYTPSVELWVSGTGENAVSLKGGENTASGKLSVAEGSGTTASGSQSHAEGQGTHSNGQASHAEGSGTIASGGSSHAEGITTSAMTPGSHAEGLLTTASGLFSHAEGQGTTASGNQSHSEGSGTTASGMYSHAEGAGTTASGSSSHAEGNNTIANDYASHAEGSRTIARGASSHAEGGNTIASNYASHAEGSGTIASGYLSHAEGEGTSATSNSSHAEGNRTIASGGSSHAEGFMSKANGDYSHAEGYETIASGMYSHAEGYETIASGYYSHSEGYSASATSEYSHAEGTATKANGQASHSEGAGTAASGNQSHSEGSSTIAIGNASHAEGGSTKASNYASHAEGTATKANGYASHAEGDNTTASGYASHAEGNYTTASGYASHAEGSYTITNNASEHASGQYNVSNSATTTFGDSGNTLFSVGNGTTNNTRHNAFEIRQNGDIYIVSGDTDIKLQDHIGSVETVTAITPSNSGSTDPIATKVVAENELTVSNALIDLDERKLDASAYTPTDLSNYYTKSETSGATEISNALGGKVNNATFTGHTADTTMHFTTTEKSNLDSLATNIAAISGITSTKVGNWDTAYTNNHTHGNKTALDSITGSVGTMAYQNASSYSSATQVNTALEGKVNTSEYATFSAETNTSINDLNGQSETIAAALNVLNKRITQLEEQLSSLTNN